MRTLPDTNRSDSRSYQQSDGWDFEPTTDATLYKEQIKKANSVPILSVIKAYGIKIDQGSRSIACPFSKRHKRGQDRSPSFYIYTNTNSFWCFGCKTGNTCVDFVSNIDSIGILKAAEKILMLYKGDITTLDFSNNIDYSARLKILVEFSNYIREIIISTTNPATLNFLEEVCAALDNLNNKYKKNMDNDMLLAIIDRLRKKVEEHIKCQA